MGLQSVLPRQGLLENEQQMAAILKYVPDNGSARESLQRAWQACRPRPGEEDINLQRWHKVVEVCEKVSTLYSAPKLNIAQDLRTFCPKGIL